MKGRYLTRRAEHVRYVRVDSRGEYCWQRALEVLIARDELDGVHKVDIAEFVLIFRSLDTIKRASDLLGREILGARC